MKENLENVNCNFCKNDNFKVKYVKEGFNIVRCKRCSLVYVNPRLTQQAILNQYDEEYFKGGGFDKSIDYETEYQDNLNKTDLNDWDISAIKEMISFDNNSTVPKLLDAGCGMGLFLSKAKAKGFDVYGLEYSKYAAEFVASKGIPVENTTIDSAELEENYFDVIVMKEVIEHLPDPLGSLNKIYRALKPGGLLFLTTGNYNSPERIIRGKNWFYFMPEGHLYIFSNKTMKNYLIKTGFRKIDVANQGDLLHNFMLKKNILDVNGFYPRNIIKRIPFVLIRTVNHFISSGMRIYAIK